MYNRKKRKTPLRVVIMIPYLLLLFVLQAMVFPRIRLFGVRPLILPLAVAGTALFGGRIAGGTVGLFAGMLTDLSFNQPTIQFTIILTVLGLAFGALADSLLVQGFPSFFLCSLGILVVCAVCQIFPLLFFQGTPFAPLFTTAAFQTFYSLFFTLPVYYLSRIVGRAAWS